MKIERIEPIPLDLELAKQYAERIANRQLDEAVKTVQYLGGGSFGRAFGVEFTNGQKIVVKFLLTADMLEKEVHDLRLLKENCPVNVPRVLFTQKAGVDIPVDCYGMEWIAGKSALTAFGMLLQSKKKRKKFADEVTTALRQVHCCQNEKFGDTLSPDCAEWLDYYRPFAVAVLEKAEEMHRENLLSEKIIAAMRAAWEKFDVIFSEKVTEACLIHGDLNVANIMVGEKFRISGFIDPLNSAYADREYDLFQFDNLTGKRFYLRKTYLKKYGASKFCDAKCAFYALWNEVYCYIKSGALFPLIMNPLIKNMYRQLKKLGK